MQENKNLILAIVLCLVVLFGWGRFAEYMGWVKPAPAPEQAEEKEVVSVEPERKAAPALPLKFAPGREFKVDTPLYEAIFTTGGGALKSFKLKKYRSGITPDSPLVNLVDEDAAAVGPLGLVVNKQPSWSSGQWSDENARDITLREGEKGSFVISGEADNLRIRREFSIDADIYLIREKIFVSNPGEQTRTARIAYTEAMDASRLSGGQYDSMVVAWDDNGSLEDESSAKTLRATGAQATGNIYWAGPMTTYFLSAIAPAETAGGSVKARAQGEVYRVSLEEEEFTLAPGEERELRVSYWMGPKDRKLLSAVSDQLAKSIDLGFFSVIGKGLIWLLEFFYDYVHNWGVAIILLTFLIKAVFWPLTAKSYNSMEKMKELQPMMLKIREKYKDNREEMNKEIMGLYKTYKVNPMSGCVPMLIQIPVFFGLYQALLSSIALRHASFIPYLPGTHVVWLADLSAKDPLYITPIVMGLTMFLQQRMSPAPADPIQAKVMMFLPLIFTVLFLNFPAGLVVYWLVNNILTIFQQWLSIRKHKKRKSGRQIETKNQATNR
ncbi:MAG: membrane protein insertase YidC [Desulfovibrio sp.]|nr:membrane protein insertase YidC [Desulfovibrio sp.]